MKHNIDTPADTPLPPISSGNMEVSAKGILPGAAAYPNSMARSVSSGTLVFRPNNYRRQIVAHELSKLEPIALSKCYSSVSYGNHNKLVFIRDYPGVLLQVGRRKVTAIWSQPGKKDGLTFAYRTPQEAGAWLRAKVEERRVLLDAALMDFCGRVGVLGTPVPVWERSEDGFRGDPLIDTLPPELVVDERVFKKVYRDWFEFKGGLEPGLEPGEALRHFINNRALEEVAPMVAERLDALGRRLDPLGEIQELVRLYPDDLLKSEVRALVGRLTAREKEVLSEWTFVRFGSIK